jgi:hypothetical protein
VGSAPVNTSTARSLVTFGDNFAYFSASGVIQLTFDSNLNQFKESSLTNETIKTLYSDIPLESRKYASGHYAEEDNVLFWMYSSDGTAPKEFDTFLCYNIILKAWFKFKIDSSNGGYIQDAFRLPSNTVAGNTSNIFQDFRFLVTTTDYRLTIAYLDTSANFKDFVGSTSESEQQGFIQTGYLNANDSAKEKQSSYIVPSFLRTEDGFTDDGNGNLTPTNESSCMISAYWDYADDDVSGKINDPFEAYRYNRLYIPEDASDTFNYGQSVLTTKNRLTGRGRALSLRFETSVGKDCQLLGWNLDFGANGKV